MQYNYLETIGFAQIGQPDFEEQEKLEIDFFFETIEKICGKIPKDCYLQKNLARYTNSPGEVYYYHDILLCGPDKQEKAMTAYCDKVNAVDWEEYRIAFDGFKINRQVKDMLHKMGEQPLKGLTLMDVAKNNGKKMPSLMLLSYANQSEVPSMCPHNCFVEPDGECEHGFQSIYLASGMI